MPILTKPGSLTKGEAATLELDKSLLAAVTSVAADDYFSDSTNWKFVKISYRSSEGNQRYSVSFDCSQSSPEAILTVSEKARDIFEMVRIIIVDFDGGQFLVDRSEVTGSEFDLDYTPPPAGIDWNTKYNAAGMTFGSNGAITPTGGTTWTTGATSTNFINDNVDFTLTYNINGNSGGIEIMFGFNSTLPNQGDLAAYAFYLRGGSANIRVGGSTADTAAVPDLSELIITRTGSSLVFKVNGVTKHTTTYTGKVYPYALFGSNDSILLSAYLV